MQLEEVEMTQVEKNQREGLIVGREVGGEDWWMLRGDRRWRCGGGRGERLLRRHIPTFSQLRYRCFRFD